jgi:hypothetical protein
LRRKKFVIPAIAGIVALVGAGVAYAYFTSTGSGTGSANVGTASNLKIAQLAPIYDSIASPVPAGGWSLGFDATSTTELGGAVNLASSAPLNDVVVLMDSWACEAGSGTTCVTTAGPGDTFPVSMTLTIYSDVSPATTANVLATDTQLFNIPFRPSADNANCTGTNAGKWYDASTSTCYNGSTYPATFNDFTFTGSDVLPSTVVYGISYDTTNTDSITGDSVADASPVNSLNVLLSEETVPASATDSGLIAVGSDADPGNLFVAGSPSGAVGGSGGEITCSTVSSTYTEYSTAVGPDGCGETTSYSAPYTPVYFIPAVEFNVVGPVSSLYPGGPALPVDFTVTNPGAGDQYVSSVTVTFGTIMKGGSPDTGCGSGWFTLTQPNPVNTTIPGGQTIWVVPSGASIALNESGTNQDACETAQVNLSFSSN